MPLLHLLALLAATLLIQLLLLLLLLLYPLYGSIHVSNRCHHLPACAAVYDTKLPHAVAAATSWLVGDS